MYSGMSPNFSVFTLNCSCIGKLFSHSLQSLVPMHMHPYAYGHETLQGMGK